MLFYDLAGDVNLNSYDSRLILAQTRRALFLEAHENRIAYYRGNIIQRSVTQMAADLDIRETDVYHQLWLFGFSIEETWDRARLADGTFVMDRVRQLLSEGQDVAVIANQLGVGEEALVNILHFKRILVKGERWTDSEVQTLLRWYGMVTPHTLTMMLGRNETSITTKARKLNISGAAVLTGSPHLWIDGFGFVKVNGRFQQDVLAAYLRTQFLRSNQELAETLECSATAIDRWRKQLGLETFHPASVKPVQANRSRSHFRYLLKQSRFEAQRVLITRSVDYFERTGVLPAQHNHPVTLGTNWSKAMGTGQYFRGDSIQNKAAGVWAQYRIFDSSLEFWVAFESEVARRRTACVRDGNTGSTIARNLLAFSTFDLKLNTAYRQAPAFLDLLEKYRSHERARVITFTVDQFVATGKMLLWEEAREMLGTSWDRVMGTGKYKRGDPVQGIPSGVKASRRVFDSSTGFWLAFVHEIERRSLQHEAQGTTDGSEYQRLQSFSPRDIRGHPGYTKSAALHLLLDQYRHRDQQKTIAFAVDRFGKTGKLPGSENA